MSKMLVGRYEATIYPEGYGFTGAISLGFDGKGTRQRIKRKGRTKAIVKDKLIKVVADREARKAGLGENWTPRELRHSFVSIMSDNGVPIETIADLVGHASTAVTEEVYRHQLKPVITKGAETMNTIFNQQKQAKSA